MELKRLEEKQAQHNTFSMSLCISQFGNKYTYRKRKNHEMILDT